MTANDASILNKFIYEGMLSARAIPKFTSVAIVKLSTIKLNLIPTNLLNLIFRMHTRILLVFLICFIAVSDRSYSQQLNDTSINQHNSDNQRIGKWVSYWIGTTKLASIEQYKEGRKNGICEYYYQNGIIREKSEYQNDTLNGYSESYSPTGTLRESSFFIKGKSEGLTKYYNYKKIIVEEDEYHNNVPNGTSTTYYESGRMATKTTFINGKENGTRTTYKDSDNKEIILETDFLNDVRIERRYYKHGLLIKTVKDNVEEPSAG